MDLAHASLPRLAKYELIEELGHGGMATVYRGRDQRLGREVAVKVIHRHLRESEEVSQRFVAEARAVAKLRHPNIVEVYDVSDPGDTESYLVVELVEGTSLRKLLRRVGYLPPEVAAIICVQVASALDHAHQRGVVHRDVKPENILVPTVAKPTVEAPARAAMVKVTDFGIAKLLDAQGVTSTGQVLGSPAHMAPEQIEGGEVDGRADVFGLGVLLYECMTGTLPFQGSNPAQVLRRVLEGTFVSPEKLRSAIGSRLSKVVCKALAQRPDQRYSTAGELAKDLRHEVERLGIDEAELLSRFLSDPEKTAADFPSLVVPKLLERARAARKASRAREAADDYNRAIAYRADDKELLAEVANLSFQAAARVWGIRGLFLVLVIAIVGLGVHRWRSQKVTRQVASTNQPLPKPRDTGAPTRDPEKAVPVLKAPNEPSPKANGGNAPNATRRASSVGSRGPSPMPRQETQTRPVKIVVSGPQNTILKIDGEEVEWFGRQFQLTLGAHTFEFLPPNDTCCVGPVKLTRVIEESEPTNRPIIVAATIETRPARLVLNAPEGSEASCGPFGTVRAGEERRVVIDKPVAEGHCTVFPPAESGAAPKRIDVTLRAGERFVISWP